MQNKTGFELHELLLPENKATAVSQCSDRKRLLRPFAFLKLWRRLQYGWRFGTFMSCILVGIILCFNIAFTIYVLTVKPPSDDGVGELSSGRCHSILSASTKIHILINVCSAVAVAASNYNMQCLSAPTRADIDKAHRRRKHLQIGVQSLKNLRHLQSWKVILWVALLVSTLPLHFLWNSAIFPVIAMVEYAGIVVRPDFLAFGEVSSGLDCSDSAMSRYQMRNIDQQSYVTCSLLAEARQQKLAQLSPTDCIKRYDSSLTTGGYNFIAVTKVLHANQAESFPPAEASLPVLAYFDPMSFPSRLATWCGGQCRDWCEPWRRTCNNSTKDWEAKIMDSPNMWCSPTDRTTNSSLSFACYQHATNRSSWAPDVLQGSSYWTCDPDHLYQSDCSTSAALQNSSHWTILPEHYEIDYCLVSEAIDMCQLRYSSSILLTVVVCNAIKFFAILSSLLFARTPILATTGDAISSFLREPDTYTEGDCLFTTNDIGWACHQPASQWSGPSHWQPRIWHDTKGTVRWIRGASSRDLIIMWTTWLLYLLMISFLLYLGLDSVDAKSILDAGFGALNMGALIGTSNYIGGSNASILTTSLLVNLPQVVSSSLYFIYNSIYTSMASAYEWSLRAHVQKSLRVTSPSGLQRSTYWLQLPWKFSFPLLCASALLHWLISQSIFLVNVRIQAATHQYLPGPDAYFPDANEDGYITGIGYSPLPIICATVLGFLMFISLFGVGCFKLKPGIPAVGSNSLGISAACHPPDEDNDAALKPVLWGATRHQDVNLTPGHCGFSSLEVDKPRAGDIYA